MTTLKQRVISEFLASFIVACMALVFVIPLAVHGYMNQFELAVIFGLVCAFVIAIFNTYSGAHFNPGVTIAMVITGRQEARTLGPYILAQCAGWFAGTAVIYIVFWNKLREFNESGKGNSVNLLFCSTDDIWMGFWIEFAWAAMLLILILASLDGRLLNKPGDKLFPYVIGAFIAVAIAFGGPYTGMALNAARDFGPRFAALIFGEINGYDVSACFSTGMFILYLIAPNVGAVAGALFYDKCLTRLLPRKDV